MEKFTMLVEMRKHLRAKVQLPARIRWHRPLGMRLEVTHTVDVSREGLLIHRSQSCDVPARVWVAFPFAPAAALSAQPETPARIVRVEEDPAGGYRIGVRLQPPPRGTPRPADRERRCSPRVPFALPLFVRPSGTPWPEESMTQDISRTGARFETSHIYAAGDMVLAKIPWGEWTKAGEIPGRVVRVEGMEDVPGPASLAHPEMGASAIFTSVAVQWIDEGKTTGAKKAKS
jgi:PilZ domain